MANKSKEKKIFVKRLVFLLPLCIVLLVVLTTTIGQYWVKIINKSNEKSTLNEELISLKEKEAALTVDVEKLQDPDYIARYAREKYMFSKDGEIILRFDQSE